MARKQITQFTAASAIALTDRFLLQQGATGTAFTYGTVTQLLNGGLASTYSSVTVNGSTVPVNGIYLPASNTLGFAVNTTAEMQMTGTALSPATSDGLALGTTALMWSDAFLASGAVLNFNNGDVTVTHSADTLTVAGGGLSLTGAGTGLAVTNNATIGGTVITTGSETAAAFIPASATIPTNGMYLPAGNTLGWAISSAAEVQLTSTALSPAVSDGSALGTSSLMWGDLFLASGGVINFNAGNVTITHSADALAITGASVTITRNTTDASGTATVLSIAGAQSVANTGIVRGLNIGNSYSGASGNTLATLYGTYIDPSNASTGTVTQLNGIRTAPYNASTGTVTTLAGVISFPANLGAGTVTTTYGVRTRIDNLNAGGTITDAFGVFIATPLNSGTITNRWGLYQEDTSAKSFIAGRTLIGTVTDDGSTAFQVNGNAKASYYLRTVGNALTATGSTRGDALQLANETNRLTTVASGTGVILPVGVVGMRIRIYQSGANPVKVYASASETIDGVAGATGVTLTNALRCEYEFVAANTWISAQLGVVSA